MSSERSRIDSIEADFNTLINLSSSIDSKIKDLETNDKLPEEETTEEDKTVEVTFKGSSYSEYSNEYLGDVIMPISTIYDGIMSNH